ncbi:hypothetical protein RQP46_007547 [Phenoliferia psychrophenolica]
MGLCTVTQIWFEFLNDIHATVSVSGLSFCYALATLVLCAGNFTGWLSDMTDLDLCVAVIVGSLASIWASTLELATPDVSWTTAVLNMINAVLIAATAFIIKPSAVSTTGVTHLEGAAQITAWSCLCLACVSYIYEMGVGDIYLRLHNIAAGKERQIEKTIIEDLNTVWRRVVAFVLFVAGTILCWIALYYRPKFTSADGTTTSSNIIKIDPSFSYGQAYGCAAALVLLTNVLVMLVEEMAPQTAMKIFGQKHHRRPRQHSKVGSEAL